MSKRVLYIEDNPRNMRLARKFLEFEGYQVLEAVTGLEGIDTATNEKPDLILMDVNLPDIDGLEATGRLKAATDTAHMPIIALTANAMQGDKERCLAAGCDGYLSKPINRMELLETVAHHIETVAHHIEKGKSAASKPKETPDSNLVLVIEDNEQNARLVKKMLEKNGFAVRLTKDGESGITAAMEKTPNLILVDLGLPDMDGQTVITLLRQQTELANLPILAFTAWPKDTATKMAKAYGFNGIISKPVDSVDLIAQIRSRLSAAYDR